MMNIMKKFAKRLICAILALLGLSVCSVFIVILLPFLIVGATLACLLCPESWYKGGLSMEVDPDLDID